MKMDQKVIQHEIRYHVSMLLVVSCYQYYLSNAYKSGNLPCQQAYKSTSQRAFKVKLVRKLEVYIFDDDDDDDDKNDDDNGDSRKRVIDLMRVKHEKSEKLFG